MDLKIEKRKRIWKKMIKKYGKFKFYFLLIFLPIWYPLAMILIAIAWILDKLGSGLKKLAYWINYKIL